MKRFALLPVALLLVLAAPSSAAQQPAPQYCSTPYFIEQPFPTTGPEVSRWVVCWQVVRRHTLVITGAWFRPTPASKWIRVLWDGRLSQLFVPYHSGSPRFLDVTEYDFGHVPLNTTLCPAPRKILGAEDEVCKSVEDRGILWTHGGRGRRGERLTLWSILGAGNYDYIIEWSFRDDGTIEARVGATGQPYNDEAHMHGVYWRLDVDLDGACCDTAGLMSHKEIGALAFDSMFHIDFAAGLPYDPSAYEILHIGDAALKNGNGKPSEWHLMPSRSGTPRHLEPYAKDTYWVTPYVWNQLYGNELPDYVKPKGGGKVPPPTKNTDIVLWYYGGLHHIIRDEDLRNGYPEMTLAMFEGFLFMPFNLWDTTPFCDDPAVCTVP